MSRHTPGPWHMSEDGKIWAARAEGPRTICRPEDFDEDAYLIAAAPDLLAACEAALGFLLESDLGDTWLADKIHDAIWKATGDRP